LKQELMDYLDIQFRDNVKARVINQEQDNSERNSAGSEPIRAQTEVYRYLKKKPAGGGKLEEK
jgi:polyphosphate kinase